MPKTQHGLFRRGWGIRAVLTVLAAVSPATAGLANTFNVNDTSDTPAVAPVEEGKDSAGNVTLRSAVMGANAHPGPDYIVLPASASFTLSRGPADSSLGALVEESGDLDITDSVTIQGNNSSINAASIDRVFDIQNASLTGFTVAIDQLALSGGTAHGLLSSGGLINIRATSLKLTNSTLSSGTTEEAGSVDNGGLIAVNSVMYPAPVTASLTLFNCVLTSGTGRHGGAIVCGNATVSILESSISGNTALDAWGGAIAIFGHTANVTVNRCVLHGNHALAAGGAIAGFGNGLVTVNNTTISQNNPGGIAHAPGFRQGGYTYITNATITANVGTATVAGGVFAPAGTLSLRNTIVAGNTGSLPDLGGLVTSKGYNLIGRRASGTMSLTTGDQAGTLAAPIDPLLGPLADNSGPTMTHALLTGSPALDKGTLAGETIDQRGIRRPQGVAADIGAYEANVHAGGRYSYADALRILRIALGTETATDADLATLNVIQTGYSEDTLDIQDALSIERKAAGLEPNP